MAEGLGGGGVEECKGFSPPRERIELEDGTGTLRFWPCLFCPSTQARLFKELILDPKLVAPSSTEDSARAEDLNGRWMQRPIKMFGREILQPRLTCFYGCEGIAYRYSGKKLDASPWEGVSPIQEILSATEAAAGVGKGFFNCVLLNWYRTGEDYMGWHSDDEKELEEGAAIASVSLGEERTFQLRRKSDHSQQVKLELGVGSLLLMEGDTQRYWQHRVPKRSAKDRRQEMKVREEEAHSGTEGVTISTGGHVKEGPVEGRSNAARRQPRTNGEPAVDSHLKWKEEQSVEPNVVCSIPATGRINLTFRRVSNV